MKKAWKIAITVSVVVVAVICIVSAMAMRGHPREVRLTDGTVLRLEKVSFGKREPFKPGGWWQRTKTSVAAHLPKRWADKIVRQPATTNKSTWGRTFYPEHTNDPALHVWLTRMDPATASYVNVDVRSAELVDADGCVIGCTLGGGDDPGLLAPGAATPVTSFGGRVGVNSFGGGGLIVYSPRSSVTWFSFEVFPRREKEFKLKLYDSQRKLIAEFIVPNPAPRPPTVSPAPTLPVTVTNGAVVFKLTGASLKAFPVQTTVSTSANEAPVPRLPSVTFSFETLENGLFSENWDLVALELRDSSGNTAPKSVDYPYALCPGDSEWRLEAKFAGREDVSNRTWTVRGLAVPGQGTTPAIPTNTVIDGLSMKLIGTGGPGRTVYSNEVGSGVSANGSITSSSYSMTITRNTGVNVYNINSTLPHVAIVLGEIGVDQRVSVRAIDEQGRQYNAQMMGIAGMIGRMNGSPNGVRGAAGRNSIRYLGRPESGSRGFPAVSANNISIFMFDLPLDVKTIDLEVRVHRTRNVEFRFKPPQLEAK